MTAKLFALFVGCLVAAAAVVAIGGDVSASGDQCQHTHGEDPGYYDENNNNPFEDDEFPGLSQQNRTGM